MTGGSLNQCENSADTFTKKIYLDSNSKQENTGPCNFVPMNMPPCKLKHSQIPQLKFLFTNFCLTIVIKIGEQIFHQLFQFSWGSL